MALFAVLVFCILLFGVIYLYNISAIMIETVNRDHNLERFQLVEREYQELEKNYLGLLSKFNLDYVYSLGFVSSGNASAFITREIQMAQSGGYEKTIR